MIGYCENCKKKSQGIKPKVNGGMAVLFAIFTLGISLLFFIPYRAFVAKDRCQYCGLRLRR